MLQTQLKYSFVPQSVPAFSAVETLMTLEKRLAGYSYRSTMLNPTNPRDRPSDWETDVIRHLHDKPELKEVVGLRDTPTGQNLYIARPNRINDAACMECHSVPSRAPKTLHRQIRSRQRLQLGDARSHRRGFRLGADGAAGRAQRRGAAHLPRLAARRVRAAC